MKTICFALAALFLLAPTDAHAATPIRSAGNFGIGLGGGTAAGGLSGKYFLSGSNAVQATVGAWGGGWGYDEDGGLAVGADYLFEMPALASPAELELAWNAGLGAGLGVGGGDRVFAGASGIVGLELNFVPVPVDLVLEWRPTLGVLPGVGFDAIVFSGHIRVYPF